MARLVKVSDYVIEFLHAHEMRDVFVVSGGGIMHLLDSLGRNPEMRYYCNYHEQACAYAAEGHARISGKVGAFMVTVGPGMGNAISGLVSAWYDSIPVMAISGNVRRDLMADFEKVRQIGSQEGDALGLAKPITKYAVSIVHPELVRFELEKAYHLATSGRPGPVWVEIPLDVQDTKVDADSLIPYTPPPSPAMRGPRDLPGLTARVVERLLAAKRPLILLGNGLRRAHAEPLLAELLEKHRIPCIAPFSGKDLLHEDHPLNMGIYGTAGQRRANFALQSCDLLLSLGVGLTLQKVGFNFAGIAPRAFKIVNDIDAAQLYQQAIRPDLGVEADAGVFLRALLDATRDTTITPSTAWLDACKDWKATYSMVEDKSVPPQFVNAYEFVDALSDELEPTAAVVGGVGIEVVALYQAFRVKRGQRVIISGNWGAMGLELPTAVGACIANGSKRTVVLVGDGGVQWNVQELLTISHNRLPVTVFVFNNRGYSCIRATQDNFFEGRYVAAEPGSGVGNPDFEKLAAAYHMSYDRIQSSERLTEEVRRVLARPAPLLCEINMWSKQAIVPRASAVRRDDGKFESRPLEDMSPPLPREELARQLSRFDE